MTKFVLPYEPQYIGHRDSGQQNKNALKKADDWLPRHDASDEASSSLVPELTREIAEDEKVK